MSNNINQMCRKERLLQAYDFLYEHGIVHSVTDLAEKMGRNRTGVSQALNGSPAYLNEKFLKSFSKIFDMISEDFLLNGNGPLLKEEVIHDDGLIRITESIDPSSLVNAALAAKDETIKAKDEIIASLRETIEALRQENRLLKNQQKEEYYDYPYQAGVADSKDSDLSNG